MTVNRREALTLFASAATATLALAQDNGKGPVRRWSGKGRLVPNSRRPPAPCLPLKTTGLEHIGVTVTNPEASAKFYGQIFDPQLFKERDIANRFYCKLGTAYLAFGTNADVKVGEDRSHLRAGGRLSGSVRAHGARSRRNHDGRHWPRRRCPRTPTACGSSCWEFPAASPARLFLAADLAGRSHRAGDRHRPHHPVGFEPGRVREILWRILRQRIQPHGKSGHVRCCPDQAGAGKGSCVAKLRECITSRCVSPG